MTKYTHKRHATSSLAHTAPSVWPFSRRMHTHFYSRQVAFELELELTQAHMAQEPLLWVETGAHAVRSRSNCGGVGCTTHGFALARVPVPVIDLCVYMRCLYRVEYIKTNNFFSIARSGISGARFLHRCAVVLDLTWPMDFTAIFCYSLAFRA